MEINSKRKIKKKELNSLIVLFEKGLCKLLFNKYLKKYILQDYRLTFRSELCVADIEYKKGSSVQGALYEITNKDETCLDKYEDFPILYKKIFFKYEGRDVMAYSMEKKTPFKYPSTRYLNIIKQYIKKT